MKSVTILGATGSIGSSTLDVVRQHREQYRVFALTAHSQIDALARLCEEFQPVYAVVAGERSDAASEPLQAAGAKLRAHLASKGCTTTEVLVGDEALAAVASDSAVDIVMAAIVGAAGLSPTMAAVQAGKQVLLANKESLVMGGALFMAAVEQANARLLPVDSEHNAIFQCLPDDFVNLREAGVSKLLLTGSGGPFRQLPLDQFAGLTPDQACAHPNWSMGKKISVDSATMMNKGLEFIEACWLFGAVPEQIQVLLHPQSIVHSMVEYVDGSVIAQMGQPDMRTPIAHCLAWPNRIHTQAKHLDFLSLNALEFLPPDDQRFPCLNLAIESFRTGGSYPIALNAANEIAVEAFLAKAIRYLDIACVIERVLNDWQGSEPDSIAAVKAADLLARALAQRAIHSLT